ncbi:hypothetical protein M211_1436 [Acinetobacter lactucae]|nr:hypothetical protein M211_1436 [Acinetobacter lactucae]
MITRCGACWGREESGITLMFGIVAALNPAILMPKVIYHGDFF